MLQLQKSLNCSSPAQSSVPAPGAVRGLCRRTLPTQNPRIRVKVKNKELLSLVRTELVELGIMCLQQQAGMWGRTQLLRDPATTHQHSRPIRTVVFGSQGGSCPPHTPHSTRTHRPNTPSNHSPHGNTEYLSCCSCVPRASGAKLVPQEVPEHSQSTALGSATTGQTWLSPPSLLSSGTPGWHTPRATVTQQGPSAALALTQPGELLLVSISR